MILPSIWRPETSNPTGRIQCSLGSPGVVNLETICNAHCFPMHNSPTKLSPFSLGKASLCLGVCSSVLLGFPLFEELGSNSNSRVVWLWLCFYFPTRTQSYTVRLYCLESMFRSGVVGGRGRWVSMSSRPALFTEQVLGQPSVCYTEKPYLTLSPNHIAIYSL